MRRPPRSLGRSRIPGKVSRQTKRSKPRIASQPAVSLGMNHGKAKRRAAVGMMKRSSKARGTPRFLR